MAFLWALIEAVLGHLVGQEVKARWPSVVEGLVRFAVSRLPPFHSAGKQEEWLSVLADLPGPITKLVQSLDFVRAAQAISFQEQRIANRRDWAIVGGTLQALLGASTMWLLERVEEKVSGLKDLRAFQWTCVWVLTFMVQGYARHLSAQLNAAERFASLGNDELAQLSQANANKLEDDVLNRVVDVSVIYAFLRMKDDGSIQ